MILDLSELKPAQVYFQMIQTLVPRPIAWVLSNDGPASVMMNSISTIFTMDIYRRLVRRTATERELVRVGRVATGTALTIAVCIARCDPLSLWCGLL